MSSRINKIKEQEEFKDQFRVLDLTLIGSIITSIGKLSGKTPEQCLSTFRYYEKNFGELQNDKESTTVKELCEFFIDKYDMKPEFRKYLILLTDKRTVNPKTPLVTLRTDDYKILPILGDFRPRGIIMDWYRLGEDASDSINVELIYDED